MKRKTDKVYIVSELHPQHGGDIDVIETMILQSKMGGANAVKLQLYTSQLLFGDDRKEYANITFHELEHLFDYANRHGIDLFASVFDEEKLEWGERLGFLRYKIASRTFEDHDLCEKIIKTDKPVYISNGLNQDDFRYNSKNVSYIYCVPEYPTLLGKIKMPYFPKSVYEGYSDHSNGLTASITSIVNGAMYLEKHFTLSHSLQSVNEKGHLGAMDFKQLCFLRKFCDDYVLMRR